MHSKTFQIQERTKRKTRTQSVVSPKEGPRRGKITQTDAKELKRLNAG
jgi:hypothetical protein